MEEGSKMNVVNFVQRQNHEQTNSAAPKRDVDVLESMWQGVERYKWGSLANLAAEVADRAPMEYLRLIAKLIDKD
jgi:hypothetical protein